MVELNLEPYAVIQRWRLPDVRGQWEGLLATYLETLARRCAVAGPAVVGHIKALALWPDGTYWRASVVAPDLPATRTGRVPPDCTELDLTLNVLVYGLDRKTLAQITGSAAAEAARLWGGEVTTIHESDVSQAEFPSHHHPHKEHTDE